MKKIVSRPRLGIFILLMVFLAACAASDDARPAVDSTWELTSLTNAGQPVDLSSVSPLTLNIEADHQISGFSGCNTYGGTLTFGEDGQLSEGQFYQTEMDCEIGMDIEAAYFSTLSEAVHYKYSSATLMMNSADGQNILSFSLK